MTTMMMMLIASLDKTSSIIIIIIIVGIINIILGSIFSIFSGGGVRGGLNEIVAVGNCGGEGCSGG